MLTQLFNPQLLAGVLEKDTTVTKKELQLRIRPKLDTSKSHLQKLSQLIDQLPFFQVTKDRSGQVLIS